MANVEQIFKEGKIIPDVLTKTPKNFLSVAYDNTTIENGVEMTPTNVKKQPAVVWEANDNEFYTVIMVDPDAPSRKEPKFREYLHWLVTNIPGNDINKGDVITAYVGAGPPQGTGLHRYVFLLYKQAGKLSFKEEHTPKNSSSNRPKFNTNQFCKRYNLGEPLAGNYFQAKWDEYVPTVHKQLSGKK